jgi:hypothetical protein
VLLSSHDCGLLWLVRKMATGRRFDGEAQGVLDRRIYALKGCLGQGRSLPYCSARVSRKTLEPPSCTGYDVCDNDLHRTCTYMGELQRQYAGLWKVWWMQPSYGH